MAYRFKAYESMLTYRFKDVAFSTLESSRNTDPGVANVKKDEPYEIYNQAKVGEYGGGSVPTVGQTKTGTQRTRTGVR